VGRGDGVLRSRIWAVIHTAVFIPSRRLSTDSVSVHPARIASTFDTVADPLAAAGVGAPAQLAELGAGALVGVIGSSHRLESMLVARRLAAVAALLRHRVAALLAEGRTDWRTVRLIIGRTDLVSDAELIAELDQSLAARIASWQSWSRRRISDAVDAAVRVFDPDAVRERREHAEDRRYIAVSPGEDGGGRGLWRCCRGRGRRREDPRTLDQRRADAWAR
jgi:hypothetical protein